MGRRREGGRKKYREGGGKDIGRSREGGGKEEGRRIEKVMKEEG